MSSGAPKSRRNKPAITFPVLARRVEELFTPMDRGSSEILRPIQHRLFEFPNVALIPLGLGLAATRKHGYAGEDGFAVEGGTEYKANKLKERFSNELSFGIVNTAIADRGSKRPSLVLEIDDSTTGKVNEERAQVRPFLNMNGDPDTFEGIVIATDHDICAIQETKDAVDEFLSLNPENRLGVLAAAEIAIRTNK